MMTMIVSQISEYSLSVYACMFLIGGKTARPIGTKLGTWIHLDPGTILVKVNVSENSRRICANIWANAVDVRMETP